MGVVPFTHVSARSDVGRIRKLNEDALLVGEYLWAVADGMGGHAAGDVASALVVSVLRGLDGPGLSVEDIVEAVATANEQILEHAASHPESFGLGTTLAGVAEVSVGGACHWAIFNVGDSRVYRLDQGHLSRATIDHSEVEELIMAGQLTEVQARSHPLRNVITRSVGSNPAPQVDVWVLPQSAGERFLICSDGLTTELSDLAIRALLSGGVVAEIAHELVEGALAAGGRDNVSVIVVAVERPTDDAPDEATNPRVTTPSEGAS